MAGGTTLTRSLTSLDAGPAESLNALDWLNFFVAALLTGFGPFVAVHLAENGWAPASIGVILTIGGLAGLITQVPAGELIDVIGSKRALVGAAAAAAALALTIFGLRSDFPSVAGAAIIQGGCRQRPRPKRRCDQSGPGRARRARRAARSESAFCIHRRPFGCCDHGRHWVSAIDARYISGRGRVGDPITMGTPADTRRRYSLRQVLWRFGSSWDEAQ
jgi:hypothetical protein